MKIQLLHPSQLSPMQRVLLFLVLIILLLTFIVTRGASQQALVDKLATEYVSDATNHALIIGITQNGKQTFYTFGKNEKGCLPNHNSIFELGDVSEVFTTSLLALLEADGKVSSLEPVGDILKNKVKVPYYQRIFCTPPPTAGSVTSPEDLTNYKGGVCYPDPRDAPQMMVLCDLATHSAGFPSAPNGNFFNSKNPYADYTLKKLNRDVGELPPNQAFGFEYNHSLMGMALLGEALTVKTGKDYESLLKERILVPLSMTHTFVVPTPEQGNLFLNGHTANGKLTVHRDYNALIPAAGIRSSVPDLLTFIDANLKTNTAFNIALSETHIPRLFTDYRNRDYKIGWSWMSKPITDKNKKRLYWRCAEQGGFASFLGFIKENNIGIVVLSNSANRVDNIGFALLKHLEGANSTVLAD
jgi:serine-type D-Ala-D-Ala carboxypeptidase/endopeptidase